MRLFHLVRKSDNSLIVGGTVYEDGFVHVRWNATQNMPIGKHGSGLFESVEWFLAVHGRDGEAVMKYLDED